MSDVELQAIAGDVHPCECGCGAIADVIGGAIVECRRTRRRLCGDACGRRLEPSSTSRARVVNERHRKRAHRLRVKAAAAAAGLPSSLSLRSVHAADDTGNRPADAPAPRRRARRAPRPGVSIYLRDPGLVDAMRRAIVSSGVLSAGAREELLDAVARAQARADRRAA